MASPLKFIHVNQHVDAANKKHGTNNPCITVKQGKVNRYAAEVEVLDRAGQVALRVCYRPDEPLPKGARCWIEALAVCSVIRGGEVVAALPASDPTVRCKTEYRERSGDYQVTVYENDSFVSCAYAATPERAQDMERLLRGVTVVHVSKKSIRANGGAQAGEPILTVCHGDEVLAADEVEVLGPAGELLARVTYRPHKPLPCGARCWVETSCELRLIGEVASPGKRD